MSSSRRQPPTAADEPEQPVERAEHLGWRASSSMPSKKRHYIEGVSGKGVVELQAQLYRTQEQARLQAESGGADRVQDRHVRRKAGIDVGSIKNRGVEEREARDRALSLKSSGSGADRLAESSAALERKAALYERLAAAGGGANDEEDNMYEVEFWRKGASHQQEEAWQQQQRHEHDWLAQEQGRQRAPVDSAGAAVAGSGGMMSDDMAREAERRAWEEAEEARLAAEAEADARRAARREAVRELSGQTQVGREEAAAAKAAKDEELLAKRARLKAAFINQKVQAIMATKQEKKQKQHQQQAPGSSSSGSKAGGGGGKG